jgi:hypothetical protein
LQNAYDVALKVANDYNWIIVNCVENDEIISKELVTEKIIKNILELS